jgi:hypothetical protein
MKTTNAPQQGWTWQIGYLVGASLFVIGALAVMYGITGNFFGYALIILSLLVLLVNAWVTSKGRFQSTLFSVGSALLVMSLILVGDMTQEMLYDYPGWGGNGFLLDGIAMILYVYIVPVFVFFGIIMLVKDSKNSLKR